MQIKRHKRPVMLDKLWMHFKLLLISIINNQNLKEQHFGFVGLFELLLLLAEFVSSKSNLKILLFLIHLLFCFSRSVAMICGLFGALSISPFCIIAGVLIMFVYLFTFNLSIKNFINFVLEQIRCLGFGVIMFEVPICCQFVRFTQPAAQFSQERPAWQKAVLYSVFVE